MGRVLGLDLGLKRTGVAVSDELGISVRALENLSPKSRSDAVNQVLALVDSLDVETVVIGYALLPQSGQEGMMAKRARGFCEALREEAQKRGVQVFVTLIDEWYSSKEAARRLLESEVPKKKRRALLDSEAARVLVEQYLAGEKKSDAK